MLLSLLEWKQKWETLASRPGEVYALGAVLISALRCEQDPGWLVVGCHHDGAIPNWSKLDSFAPTITCSSQPITSS